MQAEDLKREAFIWDGLLEYGENAVKHVRATWPRGNVPRMLFAWPAEEIKADDGTRLQGVISMALPDQADLFRMAVRVAERTQAYALLAIELRDRDIKVILESPHGARCWTLPVRRHGDVDVMEATSTTKDEECLGVLWRKSQALG